MISSTNYSQTMNFLFKREDNSMHAMCPPACTIFLIFFCASELVLQEDPLLRNGGC